MSDQTGIHAYSFLIGISVYLKHDCNITFNIICFMRGMC